MLPGGGATPPEAAPSSPPGGAGQSSPFLTQIQPEQIQASRLIGTTAVGLSNEAIGDVNDVIIDRNGQTVAVVIGVGGFLGIGEKDVAVPFHAVQIAPATQARAAGTEGGSAAATTGSTTAGSPQDAAGNRPSATAGSGGTSGSTGVSDRGVPGRVMVRMSKADLQAAPAFQTGRGSSAPGRAGASTVGSGGAPSRP
jgi:hypothetical protein